MGCDFVGKRKVMGDHQKGCPLWKIRNVIVLLQSNYKENKNELKDTKNELQDTKNELKDTQNRLKMTQNELTIFKNQYNLHNNQFKSFYKSTDGSIVPGNTKYKISSDNMAYTSAIPNENQIYSIRFKILSLGDPTGANMVGIASSESLVATWLDTRHYVGWCFSGNSKYKTKLGLLTGGSNTSIFLNNIQGPSALPALKPNDIVTLLLDRRDNTLRFELNGNSQNVYVDNITQDIPLYFVVGRWNWEIEVDILWS
eukprot:TRINITY_DN6125_c0_g1_i1.p1 TRINITY_DN6125_c0_g1~~TRINITY_DN6125_c0_g1_i1.p1  ORF type:complete len:256 (+),score=62.46 TRINITY_DN6125_c0_g1_i1:702-1469(+)